MMVNNCQPHIWLIPEDDADRQLAIGFRKHDAVDDRRMSIRAPAGGWSKVLDVFETEYLPRLHQYPAAHVVMLIDFDGAEGRMTHFAQRIPEDVRPRVFVIGPKNNPEALKRELKMTFENIGRALAQNCLDGDFQLWCQPQLENNDAELERLVAVVRPILFS
jgi:hypothetical protein